MNRFVLILLLINLIGFVFGIYYYTFQLQHTPWYLWLLVIDCPLFVLLFIIAYAARSDLFRFFTSVGLFKYGLWTVFVILILYPLFIEWDPVLYPLILVLHIGMMLESFILLPREFRLSNLLVIPAFILFDLADNFFGTMPLLPTTALNQMLLTFDLLCSIGIPLCFSWLIYKYS